MGLRSAAGTSAASGRRPSSSARESRGRAYAIMDRAWAARRPLVRHRGRLRRRAQRGVDRALARATPARRLTLTTKVFHSTTGRRATRARAGPDPAAARVEPGAARRRARRPLPRARARSRDAARRHDRRVRALAREGLVGARGLRTTTPHGVREALAARPARARCRTRSRCSTAEDEDERAAVLRASTASRTAVRAARRRVADGQVPARPGVPRGLAHDAAPGAVRAPRRRPRLRRPGRARAEAERARHRHCATLAFAWVLVASARRPAPYAARPRPEHLEPGARRRAELQLSDATSARAHRERSSNERARPGTTTSSGCCRWTSASR